MAVRHKHRNHLAYFKETTVCAAPASWADDGIPILHREIDVSGIKQTLVDDPSLETYGQAVGTRKVLEGARNVEFKASTHLTGSGVTVAQDAQAVTDPIQDLIAYAMGGSSFSNTTEITGGTALAPIFDEVTNFAAGQLVAFEDTTSPTKAGQVYWGRIASINGGTKTVTLHEALPFTPAAGDNVYGVGSFYIDELVLEDAVANLKTLSWFIQLHPSDPHFVWEATGCVHSMAVSGIERNAPPKLDFSVMGGNFKHSDEDGLANVAFADAIFGYPPLAISQLKCSIADAAGTTNNFVSVSSFNLDLGVGREPVQTITENLNRFEGLHSFTVKFSPTELTLVIPEYDASWYAGLKAGKDYRVCLFQGSKGASKTWAIWLQGQLVETPAKSEVGEAMGVQLKFRATPNSTGATAIEVSRVLIGIG